MYVLIKILKFCTDSPVKSYQCKYGISQVLTDSELGTEKLGRAIQEVIHYHTLRGKFSSVHPELRGEGIKKIEVGEEGLHFIRETGDLTCLNSKIQVKRTPALCDLADDSREAPSCLLGCKNENGELLRQVSGALLEENDKEEDDDDEELLRQAIALSLEECK